MKRLAALLLVYALALSLGLVSLVAQDDGPKLSDLQKLTLQNRILTYQLAEAQLQALVKDLAVQGYTLDLSTLAYVKLPEPKTP